MPLLYLCWTAVVFMLKSTYASTRVMELGESREDILMPVVEMETPEFLYFNPYNQTLSTQAIRQTR